MATIGCRHGENSLSKLVPYAGTNWYDYEEEKR